MKKIELTMCHVCGKTDVTQFESEAELIDHLKAIKEMGFSVKLQQGFPSNGTGKVSLGMKNMAFFMTEKISNTNKIFIKNRNNV